MTRALPSRASVVIVGGGIQGLSTAINLALLGVKQIIVLDAGYWQGGASGRNGTLIRPGFGGHVWTRLFQLSWREWTGLSKKLGQNVMFTERGYTMVGETVQTANMLEKATLLHKQYGIQSEMLTAERMAELLPAMDRRNVTAALHQPRAGVAPHHAVMKAYLAACEENGVDVRYRTKVTAFDLENNQARGVYVGEHLIACDTVLVAAGPHNPELAKLAGTEINGFMMRIEAMALEPTKPLIKPALALIDSLAYFHQTSRGEVVGGTEVPETPQSTLRADISVVAAMARIYTKMFPQLSELKILRQWAGLIHVSDDYAPMLGEHPKVKNLWFSAGWSYGYAGAPGAGLLLAKAIAKGVVDDVMRPFSLDRFDQGKAIEEAGIVLIKN